MKKNLTTPEDADEFAGYIEKWQLLLNLHDWRICRGKKAASGVMADVSLDHSAKMAIWRLGRHFGSDSVNAYSLESTAVHEMLHVLLADYREAVAAKASDDLISAAEHRIVNTLERLLVTKPGNV